MQSVFVVASSMLVGGVQAAHRYCGNYCGPSWCNGQYVDECSTTSGAACTSAPCKSTGYSAAPDSDVDDCCRSHDICCAGTDRRGCNDALLSCWHSTPWTTPMCKTEDGIGFPAAALETGMYINGGLLGHDCCGGDCNAYELELTANETVAQSVMAISIETAGNSLPDESLTSKSSACGGLAGSYSFTRTQSVPDPRIHCNTCHASGTATITGGSAFFIKEHATSTSCDGDCSYTFPDQTIIGQCMDDGSITGNGITGVFVGTELILQGDGFTDDLKKTGDVAV